MSKLRPGLELTEVRSTADLNEGSSRGKPGNPYLDGKRGNGGRAAERCMNLKSTGFGPSKMNADVSMPKLDDHQKAILTYLDQCGTVHDDLLAAGTNLMHEECQVALDRLKKADMVCMVTRGGGGWTLLAEGRRVACLLSEAKPEPLKPKRKRA